MTAFPLTTLAAGAALIIYIWTAIRVGRARVAFGVSAPASGGHVEFDKRYRVQMNTLEQLVLFLPALWLALPVLGDLYAALIGAVWVVGRIIYAAAYVRDPATRSLGFGLTIFPSLVLLIAGIFGAVQTLNA